jgi:hypothetical protein
VSPVAIPLSVPQSERLSQLTSIDASRLVGRTLAEVLQSPEHSGEAEEHCEWVPLFEIEWATRECDRRRGDPEAARPD